MFQKESWRGSQNFIFTVYTEAGILPIGGVAKYGAKLSELVQTEDGTS